MKPLLTFAKLLILPFLIGYILYSHVFQNGLDEAVNKRLTLLEEKKHQRNQDFILQVRKLNLETRALNSLFKVPEIKIEPPKKIIQVAPPIPFSCIGFLKTNGVIEFVIEYNGTIHMLHEGDQILDYQLTSVAAEKGWYKLIFLYKPFNQTQFLMVSDAT